MKSDPFIQVKDSAAWTIGRVCEQVPSTVLDVDVLNHLLPALIDGLKRETRVATNICWVIFTCTYIVFLEPFVVQVNECVITLNYSIYRFVGARYICHTVK